MKFKPTFFIAFCMLITACSCDNDDDSIQTIQLTETNYFYESDAYVYALNVERDALFEALENGTSNNPEVDEERIIAIGEIIETTTTSAGFGFPPIPPPPPICICWDVWNEDKFIVIDDAIFAFEATVTTENQELLYSTNTLGQSFNVNEFDLPIKAFSFEAEQEGYSGPATLNITKMNNQGDEAESYSVPIFIE